ncbi:helix-turn-helix domain-containing protein [Paenibacillus assamensis]|uniref:helix-turn-helix domain-containing protein n=1 Tax=Paenibacillus assamensis TaxID=311244 RepID=UPI0003F7B786|nr:helix-turn-helix transcriptional regulator [Paenibacillus assamensis]
MIDTFADIIRHRRSNLKLTMDKLAEKARVNKSIISRIENGEVKKPEITTIKSLAEALEITYDEYIRIYISLERNAEVILKILQEAISMSSPASLITEIATRYLEIPHVDSYEAIENIFTTANDVNHTSTKLALFNTVVNYSREHGVMPYIARGMYQVYMIERNDFTKLYKTYYLGEKVLDYVRFLDERDRIRFHYCMAVHAYSLMMYEVSIEYSQYVVEHDTFSLFKGEYKALAINNIIFCLYHLGRFNESKRLIETYGKLPYIADNTKMFEGFLNAKNGDFVVALEKLSECLESVSEYNLVYVVSELMNIYVQLNNFDSAVSLLEYESKMIESVKDARTTPDKWARLAYFYQLEGNILLGQDADRAFDYYLKGAKYYLEIGLTNKALETLSLINTALLENSSRFNIEMIRKTNEMYYQIINK